MPRSSIFTAENSYVRCNFTSYDSIAALALKDAHRISVACASCKPFHIAVTSRVMILSNISAVSAQSETVDSCRPLTSNQSCPYGISPCSTVAYVAVGFWTTFAADGSIGEATPCPSNYCGCRNERNYSRSICQLFPPFAAEYQPEDALCNGNRAGVLCGGCKTNFTQSLNGYSCISNDSCQRNLGWVWAVTVLGYLLYSVYIVLKSLKTTSNGLIMCVLFYGQISSFASIPPILKAQTQSSAEASWLSQVTQFQSVLSFYDYTCYGLSMGAYEATLAQLSGPAIVFVVSLVLTGVAGKLQLRFNKFFRQHNLEFRESFRVTLINVLLLLFSNVTYVVFRLITCVDLRNSVKDNPSRVFIDGTRACSGGRHGIMMAAAVLLSFLLILFCVALRFNMISGHLRACVCSAYTDSRFFWIAVQLVFRFVVTVISATASDVPSFAALAMCICTMFKLVMLVAFRPYNNMRTHCMDILCHSFLIVQFLLQIVARASESMGFSIPAGNRFYDSITMSSTASVILRCAPPFACAALSKSETLTFSTSGTYLLQCAACCWC
jgi:hypothetical protein